MRVDGRYGTFQDLDDREEAVGSQFREMVTVGGLWAPGVGEAWGKGK